MLFAIPILALTAWAIWRAATSEKAMPALTGESLAKLHPVEDGWEGQTHGFHVRAWLDGRKVELRIAPPARLPLVQKVRGGVWAGATLDQQWLHLPHNKHPLTMPMQRQHGHSTHLEVYKDEICLRVGSTGQVELALSHLGELLAALEGLTGGFREEIAANFEPSAEATANAAGGIPLGPGRWRGHNLRIFMDKRQTVLILDHDAQLPTDLRLGKRVAGPYRIGNPVVDLLLTAKTEQPEALIALAHSDLTEPLLQVLNEHPHSELHGGLLRVVLPAPLQVPLLPILESAWTLVQALESAQPKKG